MPTKKYSEEFKRQAVERFQSSHQSAAEVARELGVSDDSLRDWVQQFGVNQDQKALDENAEIVHLRKALARAEMERDILKKAIGVFSKEQR
jgi:transposase